MRAANNWEAYRVIDASDGEKLEIWNGVSLIRPDPQVIWKTEKTAAGWKNADARYIRSNSGGGRWENRGVPASWQISYGRLRFNVKLMNFKHTGIFPEQAATGTGSSKRSRRRAGI